MKKITAVLLAVVGDWLAGAPAAHAIPAFARATGTNCYTCHTVFPELNRVGEEFRMHGYRFVSAAGQPWAWKDPAKFLAAGPPVAFRASALYQASSDASLTPDDGSGHPYRRVASSFLPVGATVIAAGNLAEHFSIWLDHDFGSADSANEAFVRINALATDLLNLRVGSFELELPFSVAKTHNLFDYLVYDVGDAAASLAPFSFGEPQVGLEVSGHAGDTFRYAAALVNGDNNAAASSSNKGAFARVAAGPYAAHAGVSVYRGSAGIAPYSGGLTQGYRTDRVGRLAADVDTHLGGWRLYGAYLAGFDSAAVAAGGALRAFGYGGGFVQAEYFWRKPHLHFSVRYDHVRSRELEKLGVWSRDTERAVTPQIIWALRPEVLAKAGFQVLRDPHGETPKTLLAGVDWSVY
jgi:hypothetical protein